MKKKRQYSLKDLTELTGIESRTIRWYISEGLLRGPESMGRNAYYTKHHLKRLKTIKELKDVYKLPLTQIRRVVTLAGDEDISIEVLNPRRMQDLKGRPDVPEPSSTPPSLSRARRLREESPSFGKHKAYEKRLYQENDFDSAPDFELSQGGKTFETVLASLREALGNKRVSRQARAQTELVIDVTPDVALHIRGTYTREQIALFEELADHLRELLLGGGA